MKRIYMNVSDRGACAHFRAKLPSRECKEVLAKEGIELVCSEYWDGGDYDAYIFHRVLQPAFLPELAKLFKEGKKVVMEFDDDFWNIPAWNPASSVIGRTEIETLEWSCENATDIWVSTKELKDAVPEKIDHGKIKVLPNLMDLQEWNYPREEENGKVRIVWAGSIHHDADLQMLTAVMNRLMSYYKDKIEVYYFGSFPVELSDWARVRFTNMGVCVPKKRFGDVLKYVDPVDLPKYAETLCKLRPDIGLCPLVPHEFNRSKSNIKYLEYTLAGAAVVASDLAPYQCIDHGTDGFLVEYEGDWFRAIAELVEDKAKRLSLNKYARAKVQMDYCWASRKQDWVRAFRGLV